MKRNLRVKFFIILAVLLVCIYGVIGLPRSKDELVANWERNIKLGLDLRGGTYLVIGVQVQDAFNAEASSSGERLREEAQKSNVVIPETQIVESKTLADADKSAIVVKGISANQAGSFRSLVAREFPQWNMVAVNSTDYRLTMKPTEALEFRRRTLAQTRNTIEKKINGLGLSEASVQQRRNEADAELLIQMPGVDDPGRVKQILQTAAVLEIYEVKDGPFNTREEALSKSGGVLAAGTKLVGSNVSQNAADAQKHQGWYLVARTPVVRGPDIRDAHGSQSDLPGRFDTNFVLSQVAAKKFGAFTGANIGNRLGIVLDGKVLSVATIQSQITDQGRITGSGTQEEAADLALNLRAGSLPASIIYMQESTVGPSLGADSIRAGLVAGAVGLLAVVIAMLLYYKRSGINAILALILNSIILIACLSYFDAVLTLPGIAGVILTIGMAVDSNVLIFERIREELRGGRAVQSAVDTGFDKALVTIIDTHVTTVVSCAILFLLGSGPVKGFAVTLVIGLLANVFTAVFVSKVIFDWELSGPKPAKALSI